jgi:hypothetical protein
MTRQKTTKRSLFQALTSTFRRARTSLYEPFTDPQSSDPLAGVPGPRMAKVLPFRVSPPPSAPAPELLPAISSHPSMPPTQSLHIFLPRTSTAFAVYD